MSKTNVKIGNVWPGERIVILRTYKSNERRGIGNKRQNLFNESAKTIRMHKGLLKTLILCINPKFPALNQFTDRTVCRVVILHFNTLLLFLLW